MRLCIIRFFLAGVMAAMVSGCKTPAHMHVLIHMIDAQEDYFSEELITEFQNEYDVEVTVHSYDNLDSLSREMSQYDTVDLVKVPFGKTQGLIDKGKIVALDDFLSQEEVQKLNNTYLLLSFSRHDNKYYFIPRKFETRICVYSKSRVKDVLSRWRLHQTAIDSALALVNGDGLPAEYLLEEDPAQWDYFDIFVLGWVWAHTPYQDAMHGRIAHRGKMYSGTALRLIDRTFQCNGDSSAVMSMNDDAVTEAFYWEAVYSALGIYHPDMWKEGWSGKGVWEGFGRGEVFLSFMTQVDCFFLHGTTEKGMKGYFPKPGDMGVTVMPRACAVALDSMENSTMKGSRGITTGGWWWAIPAKAAAPVRSYGLARFITNRKNQIDGCSRFGMIPVRKDILSDLALMFGGGWITNIYNVSLQQLQYNEYTTLPSHPRFDRIMQLYLEACRDIIVDRNWGYGDVPYPERDYIARVLEKEYAPRATEIAGRD